jgi:histone acetyltransferase (RNA polymerase elongator complex component)
MQRQMKRFFIAILFVIIICAEYSCKKQYCCFCDGGPTGRTPSSYYFYAASNEKAGNICAQYWMVNHDSICELAY